MKSTLAVAAIAIIGATSQPFATGVDRPFALPAAHASTMAVIEENAVSPWNGKWQGTTVSGTPLVLELKVEGQRMTGRLMVGKQSANITDGKVAGQAFALTTGPIDGNKVDGTGRLVGDAIEFTIEGVKAPLTLTRTP